MTMYDYDKQFALESECAGLGIEKHLATRERAAKRGDTVTTQAPENWLMRQTVSKFAEYLTEYMTTHAKGAASYAKTRKILIKLSPSELAFITLQGAFSVDCGRIKLVKVASTLGKSIKNCIDYKHFAKAKGAFAGIYMNERTNQDSQKKIWKMRELMLRDSIPVEQWDEPAKQAIECGLFLINRLVEATDIFEILNVPTGKNESELVFQMTAKANEWLEDAHDRCSLMKPVYLPMIVPPLEWSAMHSGGFLSGAGAFKIPAVRSKRKGVIEQVETTGGLGRVYACLNALQNTRWRINTKVYEVMREGASSGLGGLPVPQRDMMFPERWWNDKDSYLIACQREPERVEEFKHHMRHAQKQWNDDAAKRRGLYWKLSIAEKMKDYPELFFVWNCDWRGRVYPMQQFINPQSDSAGKSLLEFAQGKPLGKSGAYWLAVHGANTFGKDKLPMDERVQWVKDNQAAILDSAVDPLGSASLWLDADEPYMFLAFCFEWQGHIEQGESFISHLPVNMDGSCSGLQHYSALLRDEIGGKAVNLVPANKPGDIYSEVAIQAQQIVAKDVDDPYAAAWHGKITRSIVKRNAMTWAYSATLYGFAEQLSEEVRKLDEELRHKGGGFTLFEARRETVKACNYLAKVNMQAISSVVVKAVEGMDYLKEVAKVVTDAGILLNWITPSGMVVIHKYTKLNTKRINTFVGKTRIRVNTVEDSDTLDTRKNKSGVAPNFIHSLDASHLVLTVEKCKENGIEDFSMIHDSFGTHAADIELMNKLLREAFVEMYSEDVMENFHKQVVAQVPPEVAAELPEPPSRGTLDITGVLSSVYFFA